MTRALVIAEHDGAALHANTARAVSCAALIAPDAVTVAVFAEQGALEPLAGAAARLAGVANVLAAADPGNETQLAAVLAPQCAALAADYTHVLAPSSTFGKDLLPRVAALLGVGQVSDVMAVETPTRFRRPIYAGNAIVTVEVEAHPVVATVRTASFAAAAAREGAAPIEAVALGLAPPAHTRFVGRTAGGSGKRDLQTADRVVAGGRGLGSKENFALVERLAEALGAAVGASRAAVDSGFAPNDLQVGQTGKIISPDLYLALGISGAIQHLTGIKDARTIVAVNKDESAPIFEVADLGLVADLFDAVPSLTEALDKRPRSG